MTLTVVDILGPESLPDDEPIPYVLSRGISREPPRDRPRFPVVDWARIHEHPVAGELDLLCPQCGEPIGEHPSDDPYRCLGGAR